MEYKLGFQEGKGKRNKRFRSIEIDELDNFQAIFPQYCFSHNFYYDRNIELKKLYEGKACIFTDSRYISSSRNYYYKTSIEDRAKFMSLKACIRRINNIYNIPVGTVVKLDPLFYYTRKKVNPCYYYKVKKENKKVFDYEINLPEYFKLPIDSYLLSMCQILRENGFLVGSFYHESYNQEYLIAYGYNKRIGISPKNIPFGDYDNGINYILYNRFDRFDKWSNCDHIYKNLDIDKIIDILKN